MSQRDGVAIVDVAHRDADNLRPEFLRDFTGPLHRIPDETEVEESDVVSGGIERRRDAGKSVWNDRIRLPLAIGADEEDPRSVVTTDFLDCCHDLQGVSGAIRSGVTQPTRRLPSRPR